MMLFSQEYVDRVKERESEKKGIQKGNMETAYKFYKSGIPIENISKLLDVPIKDLQRWFKKIEKQEKEQLS